MSTDGTDSTDSTDVAEITVVSVSHEFSHEFRDERSGVFGGTPEGDRTVTLLQMLPPNLRLLARLSWTRSIDPAR
jgi:hypothetical protein